MSAPKNQKGLKMWWELAKAILNKNGSPAWKRAGNILSIWNMSQGNSAKTTDKISQGVEQ